jgi:hypothetical protein
LAPIEGSRAATITRRCAAIRYAHRLADLELPTNAEHVPPLCAASAAL